MNQQHDAGSQEPGLAEIEVILRELSDADAELVAPPAGLWDRIQTEVATSGGSNVVALDRRRRISLRMASLGAAAAAVVVIAVGSVVLLSQRDARSGTVVASAQLAYDPVNFDALGADSSATASLVNDNGAFTINLDESRLPDVAAEAADLELWLIEPDAQGNPVALVSLGLIDRLEPGVFTVPADYDPDVFYVVDISIEPRDGDATHSARSILRGPLTEA